MSSRSKSKTKTTTAKSHSQQDADVTEFFQKSPSTQVRIDLWSPDAEPEKVFVNIREWVKNAKNPEYRPTPKGLMIEPALWDEFKKLINGFTPASKEGKKSKQKEVKPLDDSDDSGSEEAKEHTVYVVFEAGEKQLPTKQLVKHVQIMHSTGLSVDSVKTLKPTRGMVVYKVKVAGKHVNSVARYAVYGKTDGVRSWMKV